MSNSYWYGFAIGSGGVLGVALVSLWTLVLSRRLRARRAL
jgi:hypothetical protein